jgi:hypothetical protein
VAPDHDKGPPASGSPEERLERGEVLLYPTAPFALPHGDDNEFLLRQELAGLAHKNISYNPATGRLSGHVRRGPDQDGRLAAVFATFSRAVTDWLAQALPRYQGGCQPDRASFRPLEEATRRLRATARNDLLHIDAFPNRPSQGRRILRVYANVNPSEARVWVTSHTFPALLARYGRAVGLPGRPGSGWLLRLGTDVLGAFRPREGRRSAYDAFMLRFHDYLKLSDDFQERGPKRLVTFPPGSAWLAMTDGLSHAELRGRYALEHSYFLDPRVLALPGHSPAALLRAACGGAGAGRAA